MKRTRLKQVGKQGKINISANRKLYQYFDERGINCCEVCVVLDRLGARKKRCLEFKFLSFAHRHKRIEYKKHPEMLSSYNQVVLACQNGHDTIEYNRELTEDIFDQLRGDDQLPLSEYAKRRAS